MYLLKMCQLLLPCTWLSCTIFVFMFSHSSTEEEILSNQRRSVFREAGSPQTETDAYTSTSTAYSVPVLKLAQTQIDEEEVSTIKVNLPPKMNLIKNDKVKITPTSNNEILVSTYRIKDEEEQTTCILMTVDALLSFIYITNLDLKEERDAFVPKYEFLDSLTGDCSDGEKSSLTLKWKKTFTLNFNFAKTPGGERWFVSGVQLSFNTDSILMHSKYPNTIVQAEAIDTLFPTPVGRSYKCHHEIEINLTDPHYPDIKVKLLLREFTVEPFIFKNDGFGPEYLCGDGTFRSETAPFIFGSLLTLASLFTIAGYAVYRYLRVNKVQYDTME